MASTTATSIADDNLSLVSGFYGPGATICWYLTMMSCFVSWTMHPKRRTSGSIDPDFIAVLTFPIVAAAHLIFQLSSFPKSISSIATPVEPGILRRVAAIEASLNITDSFLRMCAVMVSISVGFKCDVRTVMLTITGVFCITAKWSLFILCPPLRSSRGNLNRAFTVNFPNIWNPILVLVVVLMVMALGLIGRLFTKARTIPPSHGSEAQFVVHSRPHREESIKESKETKFLRIWTLFSMSLSFVASIFAIADGVNGSFSSLGKSPSAYRRLFARVFQYLLPCSSASIQDLDQAVAVFVGITVLGFSIYSAATSCYFNWLKKQEEERRNREERAVTRQEGIQLGRWNHTRSETLGMER